MNDLTEFDNLISYIEKNLFCEIKISDLAKKAKLSVYEFRRIFSFVVGTPISEYIRKRRLSSCVKMVLDGESLANVSEKCGYENVSSFSRAFKDFFGFSPSEVTGKSLPLHSFTRVELNVKLCGGMDFHYKIVTLDAFTVCGIKGESFISDTECCESIWQKFDTENYVLRYPGSDRIYAIYVNGENSVKCYIGRKTEKNDEAEESIFIPKSTWAVFTCRGAEDAVVNRLYQNIICYWFASTGYRRAEEVPNMEVFPVDMEGDFEWEIYIPIR